MAEASSRPLAPEARRPLSPHLFVYRPMLTMVMSIAHRITGAGLYIGTLLLAWWLIAAASDAQSFQTVAAFMSSIIGEVILFCFTWALFHHMLGGIRHFIWDTGYGLEHPQREYLAQATLIGGFVLAVPVWIIAFILR